jgi:hypothetical protein
MGHECIYDNSKLEKMENRQGEYSQNLRMMLNPQKSV